ncbi:SMP-30/gluconolactonase/LRE family protein [Arthrobacter sp. StoSoilB20]|uniref:SMP-30/gluconolactonase/LRE family protein n=1 Tax=Arthrobacter sp. StoSoilB20 TaxID=2830995 RepID=UPI001CC35EE7|nr:SMP-30/gluconolactonase/LRE family protein [Arthrobacter sp. StoSoilB20]BCW58539.1 lactonase drp35 [Arthrobacter sp. StoSoilB20]
MKTGSRVTGLVALALALSLTAGCSGGIDSNDVPGKDVKTSAANVPDAAVGHVPSLRPELFTQVSGPEAALNDDSFFPEAYLEGPAFDRKGEFLYFTENTKIYRLRMSDRNLETIATYPGASLSSIAIHKDGRLFVASISDKSLNGGGRLFSINPDGSGYHEIAASTADKPINPDDLVFDRKGNLYWTDQRGEVLHPQGHVFKTSPDGQQTEVVTDNLTTPNGIALTPDDSQLIVNEFQTGKIIAIGIDGEGKVSDGPFGKNITLSHQFEPQIRVDSNEVDSEGNVYIGSYGKGTGYVINAAGDLVANLEFPDPKGYKFLCNFSIRPGTNEAFAVAGGSKGLAIYTFESLDPGMTLYAQQ